MRQKIDGILKKNDSVADPGAPDCPESIRFWCSATAKFTDRERVKVTGACTARVKTTADGVSSLLDTSAMPSIASTPAGRSTLSLQDLTKVVNDSKAVVAAEAKGKARAKTKAKAKVKVEHPTDLKEKIASARTAVRVCFSFSVTSKFLLPSR